MLLKIIKDFWYKKTCTSGILLRIIQDFLLNRYERVVCNGQSYRSAAVNIGVAQGSVLGLLLFLVYIYDLSINLPSSPQPFADGTSMFSVFHYLNTSANELNNGFLKIRNWDYQWKRIFNLDPSKQAQKLILQN